MLGYPSSTNPQSQKSTLQLYFPASRSTLITISTEPETIKRPSPIDIAIHHLSFFLSFFLPSFLAPPALQRRIKPNQTARSSSASLVARFMWLTPCMGMARAWAWTRMCVWVCVTPKTCMHVCMYVCTTWYVCVLCVSARSDEEQEGGETRTVVLWWLVATT